MLSFCLDEMAKGGSIWRLDFKQRFYKRALPPMRKCCSCIAFFGGLVCGMGEKKNQNSSALKSNKVKSCHFVVASAKIRHLTFVNNKWGLSDCYM